jgi:peptide/nickel transport system ATP-binding protein/oligopeptide transport system ATP-binding protein
MNQTPRSPSLLEVTDLSKHFRSRSGLASALTGQGRVIPAVDGVSFYLRENETVGLVGESGCGKTTVARTVLRLTDPSGGRILFGGRDITHLERAELRPLRREMQMIFQDLDAGLNPKMSVRAILREALTVYERPSSAEIERRTRELLEQVNLKESKLANFPGELSGGEKRRVGHRARARGSPAPDRRRRAHQRARRLDPGTGREPAARAAEAPGPLYLFISHDLPVVELVSHKVAVMYLGRIVEMGLADAIAHQPRHPYTRILWSSLAEKQTAETAAKNVGGVFDFERPTHGCRFAPRCPLYQEMGRPAVCTDAASVPPLRDTGKGHVVACHFA